MSNHFSQIDNELAIQEKVLLILCYAVFCYWQASQVVLTAALTVNKYQTVTGGKKELEHIEPFLFTEEDFFFDDKLFSDAGYGTPTSEELELVIQAVLSSYYDALEQ